MFYLDDKSKHLFNNILLIESKVLLKHLFSTGVQYLLDSKIKQSTFEASENGSQQEIKEMKKKLESTQEEFDKVKKLHSTELNNLVQHYEQRVSFKYLKLVLGFLGPKIIDFLVLSDN